MRKVNLQKTKPRSGAVQSVLSAYRYERSQSLKKAKQQADIIPVFRLPTGLLRGKTARVELRLRTAVHPHRCRN